jgi:CheY-like chemotaxis protein
LTTLHGGSIEAYSAGPDQGAMFAVTLPAAKGHTSRPEEAHPATRVAETTNLRLLLVEDHADTAASLGRLLALRGYAVEIATDFRTAAHRLADGKFDVLLSDIGLPDGSGLNLMHHLKKSARGRTVKGIALSGFGTQEDVQRSHIAGFSDHLTKPVDFAVMQKALARVSAEIAAGQETPVHPLLRSDVTPAGDTRQFQCNGDQATVSASTT